jgi:hypothetical protein
MAANEIAFGAPHTRGLDPDNAPIQLTILHPRTCRTPPLKGLVAHYIGGLPPKGNYNLNFNHDDSPAHPVL